MRQRQHEALAGLAQGEGASIPCAELDSGEPLGAAAAAGAEASFKHQEIGGPAGQQQRPEQHRVAEQHEGQQLPQHLEEVDGKGVRHGSPPAPCSSSACKQRNEVSFHSRDTPPCLWESPVVWRVDGWLLVSGVGLFRVLLRCCKRVWDLIKVSRWKYRHRQWARPWG